MAPEPRHLHARSVNTTGTKAPIPLPERPRHPPLPASSPLLFRPRRKGRNNNNLLQIFISVILIGCVVVFCVSFAWIGREHQHDKSRELNRKHARKSVGVKRPDAASRGGSVDSVVRYLMDLAEKRPSELWSIFGMDESSGHGQDPFSLSLLENGQCPQSSAIEWLPPRPIHSADISLAFQSQFQSDDNVGNAQRRPRKQKRQPVNDSASTKVVLWYEHISKAGGTAFCALANSNMPRPSVPRYHCMPRKGDLMDGRVGSWTNPELVDYLEELENNHNQYAIVANEWDPFDADKLKFSGRDLYSVNSAAGAHDNKLPSSLNLLFVTTLRDPSDRLLSSYSFFSEYSDEQQRDAANFGVWIKKNLSRVHNFQVGKKAAYRSNIARNNYMVWRFSGGRIAAQDDNHDNESFFSMHSQIFPSSVTDPLVWKKPFETAIRALLQHDLVIPMDVMTQDSGKEALKQILGWTQFAASGRGIVGEKESGHVVTTGEVRNSNAKSYLEERGSGEEFRALWERNWLDYILLYWARAVFFARLHCNDDVSV